MRLQLVSCMVSLLAVLSSCREVEDPLPDAGSPCVLGTQWGGDGGAVTHLSFALKLCPRSPDAGAYLDYANWVRLFDADGGQVPLINAQEGYSCGHCGAQWHTDSIGVREVREERTLVLKWSGGVPGAASFCPATTQTCHEWVPVASGIYTAKFCFSRTLSARENLGPLECAERAFDFPSRDATVGVAIEL